MDSFKSSLTDDQARAFDAVMAFLRQKNKFIFVLHGPAGTGKTFLVKKLVDAFIYTGYSATNIVGVTPTHKACKILKLMAPDMPVMTVSAFLSKRRQHGYIGTKSFTEGEGAVLNYKLVILDEVSMVPDYDLSRIVDMVQSYKVHLVAIGDRYQIPAPSQKLTLCRVDGVDMYIKADSFAFTAPEFERYELTTIVRQLQESPILQVATLIRENIYEDDAILPAEIPADLLLSTALVGSMFHKYLEDKKTCKIITYTNIKVAEFNQTIRRARFQEADDQPFIAGDVLMGYNNNGLVENGRDYTIFNVLENSHGWQVTLDAGVLLFPRANHPIMNSLVRLARKVNSHYSSKKDYAKYMNVRETVYFLENVYEFEGKLVLEREFRRAHPLLFQTFQAVERDDITRRRVDELYPELVETRRRDNKPIGDQELLCGQFCIIEKDLDYGYACTAHKSQGSTFNVAFVDLASFDRIENKIVRGQLEFRVKERNQLKYVACTRPSDILFILS